ncbi:MAG: hypothetical protein CLLPBCKN_005696 [Chroococcidiopsis cubana SAG 39.79]|nr:hypothetical protein [Chroococcidiopsis cubana SAG 39.79]
MCFDGNPGYGKYCRGGKAGIFGFAKSRYQLGSLAVYLIDPIRKF